MSDADLAAVYDLLRLRDDLPAGVRHVALRTPDLEVEVRWPTGTSSPAAPIAPTSSPAMPVTAPTSSPVVAPLAVPSPDRPVPLPQTPSGEEQAAPRHLVRAPTVGIADLGLGPRDAPLAVGDAVDTGQTVATVRIMELTVPVPSGAAGRVAEVLVEPGEAVEHDQPLLVVAEISER